jgi:hypothetical protein
MGIKELAGKSSVGIASHVSGQARRALAKVLLVLAVPLCSVAMVQADTVYDAAADLTETSIDNGLNPNGVWSYGYRNTAASTEFASLTMYGQYPIYPGFTGLKGWFDPDYFWLPAVMKNTTDTPLVGGGLHEATGLDEIIVPPGGLMMHPGDNTGQAINDAYAVLRWTAPFSATVDLDVTFTGLDYYQEVPEFPYPTCFTTTDVHVIKNGVSLFDADVTGGLYAATNVQSYSVHSLSVTMGDTIDFIVGPGPGGDFGYDSTGVDVQITVPEPSTFILIATGAISLLAYVWRRRTA